MAYSHSSIFAVSRCFQRISVMLLCILILDRVGAQNRRDEVQALVDFLEGAPGNYFNQVGSYWNTWNESATNPCAWTGVICSTNFTVVELDFAGWGSGPTGSVEPLARLRDLRHLDLSSSFFDGTNIPEDIGNLTGLVRLDLSGNNLIGPIPASISNCISLQYISLQQNQLSGGITNLRGLVNLKILDLADNLFTGEFPKDLLEHYSVVSIDFSRNKLSGGIPSLHKLTNLVDLRLEDNNFTKFEASWLPPPNLVSMVVSGNSLDGMIPPSILNLFNLDTLNMSRNQLSSVPVNFSQLFGLNYSLLVLDLSQNQLSGDSLRNLLPDPSEIDTYEPFYFNVSHNNLSGYIPDNIPEAYFVFDASYNQLSGPISTGLSSSTASITSLCLQNNLLSGDVVDVLLNLLSVGPLTSEVRLANNLFTGDLSRMASANLSAPNLMVFDISNNKLHMSITPMNPSPLRTTLETFMQSESLYEVRMAGNDFSDTALPTYFANYTGLAILDLSSNQLKGEIWNSTFNNTGFPALQLLNVSNNDLIGPVPETVVKLPNLTILDVTNNSLTGPLPFIPPYGRLYNPSFFTGNGGLCGEPLLPCHGGHKTGLQWWLLVIVIGGSLVIAMGSCLFATWRWRVYNKRHQQDADLIKTLMDKDSATLMGLRELKKATDNFADHTKIGEGGFGTVYNGKLTDGTKVAIKRSKREGSEKDKVQFLNEVKILSQVNHRHLVRLLGCCMENKIALLVFEFIPNGTLQEHLRGKFGNGSLSWKRRLNIAVQTADALNYLHSGVIIPIYHRDVKSANILLTNDLNAKVADFGISKLAPVEATHVSTFGIQGTVGYIDPEFYTSYKFSDKSDVYSFGVVLLELISAKRVVDFQRDEDQTILVNFADPLIESGDLQELIDVALAETYSNPIGRDSMLKVGKLALRCLDKRSKARPGMDRVLEELKSILLDLGRIFEYLGSINKDDPSVKGLHEDGAATIQMPQSSPWMEFECMVNQDGILKSSRSSSLCRSRSLGNSR